MESALFYLLGVPLVFTVAIAGIAAFVGELRRESFERKMVKAIVVSRWNG
jgi:predicted translin family RNA/ssDNA-binding protein